MAKAEVIENLRDAIIQIYENIINLTKEIEHSITSSMYGGFYDLFYNSIAYNLIGIILVVWAIKHMKSGFSKDDLFKGGMWLITLAFVYGTLSSAGAYQELKNIFKIPANILTYTIAGAIGGNGSNMGQVMGDVIVIPAEIHEGAWEHGFEENKGIFTPDFLTNIWTSFSILIYWLVIIARILLAVLVMIMQVASEFAYGVFSSFACIMIPLLLMPQTRANFFSWLRSIIAISLFLPMSILPMLAMQKLDNTILGGGNKEEFLWNNPLVSTLAGLLGCLIAFYILKKIPEWINVIVGSNETGSGFDIAAAQGIAASPYSAANAVFSGAKGVKDGASAIKRGASNTKNFLSGAKDSLMGKEAENKDGGGTSKNGFTAKAGGFTEGAGKGMQAGGNAMMKSGLAMSKTGVGAIAGLPLMALGAITTGAGVATRATGAVTKAVGKGMDKVSQAKQNNQK